MIRWEMCACHEFYDATVRLAHSAGQFAPSSPSDKLPKSRKTSEVGCRGLHAGSERNAFQRFTTHTRFGTDGTMERWNG